VKLARFRKSKAACFLSYVEYRPNKNTSTIINTYKHIESMYPNVGLVEKIREE
jgi:hypothetical protein